MPRTSSGTTNKKKGGNIKPLAKKAVTAKEKKMEKKKAVNPDGDVKGSAPSAPSSSTAMKMKKAAPEAKATPKKKANPNPSTRASSTANTTVKKSGSKNPSTSATVMRKDKGNGKREDVEDKHTPSTGAAKKPETEKKTKKKTPIKYKYVVYTADVGALQERNADFVFEENAVTEEFTSERCDTLSFWIKIDRLCSEIKDQFVCSLDGASDAMRVGEYDARLHWKCHVEETTDRGAIDGGVDPSVEVFGQTSTEMGKYWKELGALYPLSSGYKPDFYDPIEWNKGIPQDATLVYKMVGDFPRCVAGPRSQNQTAVLVKRVTR
ncbi:unnamed protein product [Amoebophrya sp. A120]|nr:unnamed protein product [Amoebophrya sp. A120]|eukprot:GSA120T00005046001.1